MKTIIEGINCEYGYYDNYQPNLNIVSKPKPLNCHDEICPGSTKRFNRIREIIEKSNDISYIKIRPEFKNIGDLDD